MPQICARESTQIACCFWQIRKGRAQVFIEALQAEGFAVASKPISSHQQWQSNSLATEKIGVAVAALERGFYDKKLLCLYLPILDTVGGQKTKNKQQNAALEQGLKIGDLYPGDLFGALSTWYWTVFRNK